MEMMRNAESIARIDAAIKKPRYATGSVRSQLANSGAAARETQARQGEA
jgi:hypothetical protein